LGLEFTILCHKKKALSTEIIKNQQKSAKNIKKG